ncbi:patatin-like phospholipase family protein [Streptacidiphilus sp. PAMC 29251]
MTKVGLILGGGGEVGIAWELGVLAGLIEHAGFDPASSRVIVGTSAGSMVGTAVALGHDIVALAEEQRRGEYVSPIPAVPQQAGGGGTGTSVVPEAIARLLMSGEGTVTQRSAAIGALAVATPGVIDEATYLAVAAGLVGTDRWPEADLRITSVDCASGQTVLWSRADGIGLARAVASSCAVPGYFPTVEYQGRRYCDAPRGEFCAQLAQETGLDRILFIGPTIPILGGLDESRELAALAADGLPVVQVTGGDAFAEVGGELMDPTARARAAAIGLDDGHAAAAAVTALLA